VLSSIDIGLILILEKANLTACAIYQF
jgi:hypothetical protein